MENFEKMIEEEGFVEHAKFGGNRYGTSKAMIERMMEEGKVVVLDIEMEVRPFQEFHFPPKPGTNCIPRESNKSKPPTSPRATYSSRPPPPPYPPSNPAFAAEAPKKKSRFRNGYSRRRMKLSMRRRRACMIL